MKINWTVRLKNKAFWVAFIPALLLFIQVVCSLFGFAIDFGALNGKLLAVVDAAFVLLSILGIVTDPTTVGLSDSERAMGYTEPK